MRKIYSMVTISQIGRNRQSFKTHYLHNLDGGGRSREEDVDILLKVNSALHGHQGYLHLNDKNV